MLKIENMYKLKIKLYKVISGRYLAHHKPSFGTLKMRVWQSGIYESFPLYTLISFFL